MSTNPNPNPNPTSPTSPVESPEALHLRLKNVAATMSLGGVVAGLATLGEVIALDGELGAGKTQLVRGMATRLLGGADAVASPTFVIVHEYGPIPADPWAGGTLVHVDAYRIGGEQELESIGWSAPGGGEIAAGAMVVVEWANRIESALGTDALRITLHHAAEDERLAIVEPSIAWRERLQLMRHELKSIEDIAIDDLEQASESKDHG